MRLVIGRRPVDDPTNRVWGVMDVLAVSSFPAMRDPMAVQSACANRVAVPREGGDLLGLQVEVDKEQERVVRRHVACGAAHRRGAAHPAPCTLEVTQAPWWSVYEIDQSICDKCEDGPAPQAGSAPPRVFSAGTARLICCTSTRPNAGECDTGTDRLREWARMFSGRLEQAGGGDGEGADPKEFQSCFEQHGR